ncbi:MAG: M3 family oligoendopeptidase [Alphaproteobacteria bacterium]|nr:M3 family oligoendopeptidase [Alphaproteobacteria bacterium]
MTMRAADAFDASNPKPLPEWNLEHYYKGVDDPAIEADFENARALVAAFADNYKGKLAAIDGPALAEALTAYDRITDILEGIEVFASLLKSKDGATHGAFFTAVTEKKTEIEKATTFFQLELAAIPDTHFQTLMAYEPLKRHAEWLRTLRAGRPYMLSESEEIIMSQMDLSGRDSWKRLFAETVLAIPYELDGVQVTQAHILKVMLNDTDREKRAAAYRAFGKGLQSASRIFTLITNTMALDKKSRDEIRKYPTAISSRNEANNIEDGVVDALAQAVTSSYAQTSHRFYEIKRRLLGLDVMMPYDRLCSIGSANEVTTFEEARTKILDGLNAFSPEMAQIAEKFFANGWIDAMPGKNKRGGAFAQPGVVSRHPAVMMTWSDDRDDMFTLAHELGHGIHQYLAAKALANNHLASTPLTLAETASVFGERLLFEREFEAETNPERRVLLLAGKLDDMMATVVRQIAFFEFEKGVHAHRRTKGELTYEAIGDIWMQTQKASLGPAFTLDESYRNQWSYIPHFINSPFYVYAYAFGDCLVNALYETYENTPAADKAAFVDKYLDLLRAGGSKHHSEALAPFGIDLSDPAFWQRGIHSISKMIDRLEAAIEQAQALKPTGPAAATPRVA